jgi:hypothetical protein
MNEPKRPNNTDQKAACIVRWMLETPGGWLGAWDRSAFDAHLAPLKAEIAKLTVEAERYRKWRADYIRSGDEDITPLGLALSDAWTAEEVDSALDGAPLTAASADLAEAAELIGKGNGVPA